MKDKVAAEAERRHQSHVNHPTHRPLSDGYELKGLRGEERFAEEFALDLDLTARPGGDGGTDNKITLSVPKSFVVDVKTASKPMNLIVEVGKVEAHTIYVLAGYDSEADKAYLLGWEWGSTVARDKYGPPKDFGYGVINHWIPRGKLRSIDELKRRSCHL